MFELTKNDTYKQLTATQILAKAEVAQMDAGNFEVIVPGWPETLLEMTDDGDLVISLPGGSFGVYCDELDTARLEALIDEKESRFTSSNS